MKIKIKCPDCSGMGSIFRKTGLAFITMGFSLLMDDEECDRCNGAGIILVEVPEE